MDAYHDPNRWRLGPSALKAGGVRCDTYGMVDDSAAIVEGPPDLSSLSILTVGAVSAGSRVRVRRVHGGRRLVHRLAALGVVPGAVMTVQRRRGPAIVLLAGARVALGRQAADAIEVELAE